MGSQMKQSGAISTSFANINIRLSYLTIATESSSLTDTGQRVWTLHLPWAAAREWQPSLSLRGSLVARSMTLSNWLLMLLMLFVSIATSFTAET